MATVLSLNGTKYNRRRRFLLYFTAHKDFKLEEYLTVALQRHGHKVITGGNPRFITIEMVIKPKDLRNILEKLPDKVVVSYELP